MTIAIVCNLSDGVVLGVDSAITIEGQAQTSEGRIESGVLKVYNDAEKLFALPGACIGIMTFGLGMLGRRSIGSYIKEFEVLPENRDWFNTASVEEVAKRLRDFFSERYRIHWEEQQQNLDNLPPELRAQLPAQQRRPELGFVLAGYSPNEYLSEVWILTIVGDPAHDKCENRRPKGVFGCDWFGVTHPITRFYKGFDPVLVDKLVTALATLPLDPTKQQQLQQLVASVEYVVPFDAMPLQEGVDLVKFLLSIAINQTKFVVGAPICGGDIRLGVVKSSGPLEFITKTDLSIRTF